MGNPALSHMATGSIFKSFLLLCVLGFTKVLTQECKSPLGMEDGRIKDSQITVSSFINTAYGGQARLRQNIPKWGAWCADVSGGKIAEKNYDQYIQIDLLNLTKITGIATQGRQYNGGFENVKDYKLSYRKDGGVWHFYQGKDQTVKIFLGNKDVFTVVRHNLDPTIMARYIRVHPGYDTSNNACMRLELYGCVAEKVILSYSVPVGQKTKNGKVLYEDTSYNGVIMNGFCKDGTGILTDGEFGPAYAKLLRGIEWVGWSSTLTQSQYIDITFEFSNVRKFKNVTLTVNVDKKSDHAVFNRSQIFFSSTKNDFSDTSFLQYCPRNFPAQYNPYNANVTLSLCENTARFIKMQLYFGGKWLLISEIIFNSVPASKDEKKSLQSCSGKTSHPCPIYTTVSPVNLPTTVPQTNTKSKPGYDRTRNSIVMFFVGVAVTLAIVLIVLFLIQIYKRRRQASKLSSSVLAVDTVEMQNETAPEASPNNQEPDYSPTDGGTEPYEEVQISPPSVYAQLNRNQRDGNDGLYQKLLKHDSDYVIPAHTEAEPSYEEVGKIKTSPGYKELDITKRVQDDSAYYQKLIKK